MWYEKKGETELKKILAQSPSVEVGVDRLLAYFAKRHPHKVWKSLAELDYQRDVRRMKKWFESELPIREDVEVFWFAFFDVTQGFDLRGSTKWSRDPEDWEWWYHDDFRGGMYESPILTQMRTQAEAANEKHQFMEKTGVLELVEFFFTIGYVSLAAMDIFRTLPPERLLSGRKERWLVSGFPDAVYGLILGHVTSSGFHAFSPC